MNDRINPAQRPWAASALSAILALSLSGASAAQEATPDMAGGLSTIKVNRTKNPGDLPYDDFLASIKLLQSLLPPGPRVLDMKLRLSFTGLSESERDAYLPDTWAVAIVGETLDHTIDVERGGYFLLPELEQAAKEKATIMFNAQTRKNSLQVAWKFRIPEERTLSYADFAAAFDEVAAVQKNIPWYRISLREERIARFDGLKACFHPGAGRIEIDGQPAASTTVGTCQVLKFDRAQAKAASIVFVGPLHIVTLNEVRM